MAKDFITREAIRQGWSDGKFNYPCNPGDFTGPERSAYVKAWAEGHGALRKGMFSGIEHSKQERPEIIPPVGQSGFDRIGRYRK